jgi:hypothetical protein
MIVHAGVVAGISLVDKVDPFCKMSCSDGKFSSIPADKVP